MTSECPHHARSRTSSAPIGDRLAVAQARCEAAGERWTPPRERTYELLIRANGPIGAYDLLARFGVARGSAKPTTIYRALGFLLELGLVHRIESRNMFVACSHPGAAHNPQIVICDCCARAFELDLGGRGIAEAIARERGFILRDWIAEAAGLCPACH